MGLAKAHQPGGGCVAQHLGVAGWHPILLVADLTYEAALLEQEVVPGTGDKDTLLASFAKVRPLKERLPGLEIVASHDFGAQSALARAMGETAQLKNEG